MIIEVNSKLINIDETINLNQLIFLSMVLGTNQKIDQSVRKIVSLISDDDISYLIGQGLITSRIEGNSITYLPTEKLYQFLKPEKDWFDTLFDMYPVYVTRPDGGKCYLRTNVNKCRKFFNSYVGNSEALAKHIIDCLDFEVSKKTREGKLSYMKTMWKWLVDHQWEEAEQEMQDTKKPIDTYGTDVI